MRCPYCHVDNDRVLDTRVAEGGYMVRRKRICNGCHRRFVTAEKIEKLSVRVVKADQTREPLDREKIRRGIERACSKRPIPSSAIERVVQDIETDIYTNFDSEVTSNQVGDIVMTHLARLDEVAYIRFASVYREFDDAHDFIRAISKIVAPKVSV
jgi:transcriptional repressor NrdR